MGNIGIFFQKGFHKKDILFVFLSMSIYMCMDTRTRRVSRGMLVMTMSRDMRAMDNIILSTERARSQWQVYFGCFQEHARSQWQVYFECFQDMRVSNKLCMSVWRWEGSNIFIYCPLYDDGDEAIYYIVVWFMRRKLYVAHCLTMRRMILLYIL